MSTACIVVTVLGTAMVAFSAGCVFLHAKWAVQPLTDYGVPRSWWPWLGAAKTAGAAVSRRLSPTWNPTWAEAFPGPSR
jgi:DoxX-like family